MAKEATRQSTLAKAQRNADKALRQAHADEWNEHMRAAAAAEGISDWTPPVSAEQKAKAKIEALLAEHPGLADQIGAQTLV
jgi:hypothetical protein